MELFRLSLTMALNTRVWIIMSHDSRNVTSRCDVFWLFVEVVVLEWWVPRWWVGTRRQLNMPDWKMRDQNCRIGKCGTDLAFPENIVYV